ncbi:autophagy-related protein 13-like isoform X2 [Patiria miniata]|uniref:Autophagy-related protein 13 n=1 Tax=Patiria miniata TaxID=46514 RepID=A0A913ZJ01_PATMI|nr:autophagy-related protein 13-like isoform X2 [Patiria miniata]
MMAKGSVEEPSPLRISPVSASSSNLNDRELRDLNKFIKFMAFKSVQVIVQSRSGEKIDSASKAKSDGTDWFNLAIYDNPTTKSNVKKLLAQELPRVGSPLNVEVSLETSEGDRMVLECWSLVLSENIDPNAKIHYAVYNRLGLLLKSLICISRVTPAYRIARHQLGADYRVMSRMYYGEMKLSLLGENFHSLNVGSVATPIGSVVLSVAYRTKLTLSVHQLQSSSVSPVSVRDDYYSSSSPKHKSPAAMNAPGHSPGLDDSSTMDGSSDLCATSFSTSPPEPCILQTEFTTLPPGRSKVAEEKPRGGSPGLGSDLLSGKLGAFASPKHQADPSDILTGDIPFSSLLLEDTPLDNSSKDKSSSSEQTLSDQPDGQASSSSQHSKESTQSQHSVAEDFVMVEFNPAFAKPERNSDVVSFYRQFQMAPPLVMFDNQPSLEETLEILPTQIAKFEESQVEFDSFVQSLQHDSDDSD